MKAISDTLYDEIFEEGGIVKAVKRIGCIDLGQEYDNNYYNCYMSTEANNTRFTFCIRDMYRFVSRTTPHGNVLLGHYKYATSGVSTNNLTTWVGGISQGELIIYDNDYSDAATFKTAMSGHKFYYKLNTPLTYVVDNFQLPQNIKINKEGFEIILPNSTGMNLCSAPRLIIEYNT